MVMMVVVKLLTKTSVDVDGRGCRGQRNSYGDGQYQEELGFDDPKQSKRYHQTQRNNSCR
jgi:hypothetical protein